MIPPRDGVSAYYLLDGARTTRPVARGELIRFADVEGVDALSLELHRAGLARTADDRTE